MRNCHSPQSIADSDLDRKMPTLSSPLFSFGSALFAYNEQSQTLSHQSLPHSFSCNGGGRVLFSEPVARLPAIFWAGHSEFTPSRPSLFSTTYELPNLQALCSQIFTTVGVGRGGTMNHFKNYFSSLAGRKPAATKWALQNRKGGGGGRQG